MPDPRELLSSIGAVRYGAPTGEKERLARQASLPGAPKDQTTEQQAADRYAAGFLFAFNHPEIAPFVQDLVNVVKTSDLPLVGGSSPELQSYAVHGMRMGLLERDKGTSLGDLLR